MVKVTSKGQVTLPVRIRRKLGIEPGDEVEMELMDEESGEIKIKKTPSLEALYGVFETEKPFPGKQAIRRRVGKRLGEDSLGSNDN